MNKAKNKIKQNKIHFCFTFQSLDPIQAVSEHLIPWEVASFIL